MPPRAVGHGVRLVARAAVRPDHVILAIGHRHVISAIGHRRVTSAIGHRAEISANDHRAEILAIDRHGTSVTGRHVILAIVPHATARTSLSSGHAAPQAVARPSAKDHPNAVAALVAAAGRAAAAALDRVDHHRADASN